MKTRRRGRYGTAFGATIRRGTEIVTADVANALNVRFAQRPEQRLARFATANPYQDHGQCNSNGPADPLLDVVTFVCRQPAGEEPCKRAEAAKERQRYIGNVQFFGRNALGDMLPNLQYRRNRQAESGCQNRNTHAAIRSHQIWCVCVPERPVEFGGKSQAGLVYVYRVTAASSDGSQLGGSAANYCPKPRNGTA